ncbi:hypothetical protein FHS83_001619 [Rhizomicrobium palustre]|uniref:DUF8058 domain-containing protein n=1 Tax=Rhizomicrobium palustre TaxID=189966 RepID=A0A846MYY2_9PROT|nr:hypothetical protein [Rhizomicrobium palustre]NIK88301.1 hypothetical protein [Rhizomicrobium palustre]
MRNIVSVYSVTMGLAMGVFWSVLWAMSLLPDMSAKPMELVTTLTAQFTTALLLIVSGIGMWFSGRWALRLNMFASGMLVYSLIQQPGYYLERHAMTFVVLFAVTFVITVLLSPAFKPSLDVECES